MKTFATNPSQTTSQEMQRGASGEQKILSSRQPTTLSNTRIPSQASKKHRPSTGSLSKYKIIEMIGKGTFGKVYSAIEIKTQRRVAIKMVELYGNYKNRELDIIRKVRHSNCIQLETHFIIYDDKNRDNKNYEFTLYLVMEQLDLNLAKCTQLRKKASNLIFSETQLKVICFQLFKGLDYLDTSHICHRDLKPQNILINRDTLEVKICDYGSAKIIEEGEENLSYICSRYYRAPQLLFGYSKYTTAVDIWSMGCIMLELLVGQPVFPGDSTLDQIIEIFKILGSPPKAFFDEVIPSALHNFPFPTIASLKLKRIFGRYRQPPEYLDLVKRCLNYNWIKRIKPSQALLDPYFLDLAGEGYSDHRAKLPLLLDLSHSHQHCLSKDQHQTLKSISETQANKQNMGRGG